MQNNKSKGFRSFVKEKGYYIVLLLCIVAVGVSGYFLLSGRKQNEPEEVLASATVPPSTSKTAGTQPAIDVAATEAPQTETPQSTGTIVTVRPVDGEAIAAFAADHLAYNQTTRDWRTHEGVDLGAALGAKVTAAADGTVYTIYEDESLGMTVVVQHKDGYTTHYSNLAEELEVSVGDKVAAGAVLGTVGRTANIETALEPHLHFSVYRNNTPVDPEEFLANSRVDR